MTADNFFSSIKLAIALIRNGLTFVGTLRKNKSQIPESFLPSKKNIVYSSKFAFTKDLTICSYAPKFNKSVIMLSSLHHDKTIIETNNRKPEIIYFYNTNKMGVDAFDQSCANNTCRRRTNRWPFNVFCFIVDSAVQNSFALFNLGSNRSNCTKFRKECIEALAMDMCTEAAKQRVNEMKKDKFTGIHKLILSAFESIGLKLGLSDTIDESTVQRPRRCMITACKNTQKHKSKCKECGIIVCINHCEITCIGCTEKLLDSQN
jgi:hypothetical protein